MDLFLDLNFFESLELTIDKAEELWTIPSDFIKTRPTGVRAEQLSGLLLFICRLRIKSTSCRSELHLSVFICTCALRMLLMDLLTLKDMRDQVLETNKLVEELLEMEEKHEELEMFRLEAKNTDVFIPTTDIQQVLTEMRENGSWKWNETVFENWNRIAYCVCFAEQPTEEDFVIGDLNALGALALFELDCTNRIRFRSFIQNGRQNNINDDPAKLAIALEWARRNNKNLNDELYQQGREAIISTFLTPEAQRRGNGVPSKRLAGWDAQMATNSHSASTLGFKHLDEEKHTYHSILFLCIFNYSMKQLYDIDFLKLFYADDLLSDESLKKIDAYRRERLVTPPPMLINSLNKWYLFNKGSSLESEFIVEYDSSMMAIYDWLLFIREKRKDCVFMSKNIAYLIDEITVEKTVEDMRLKLQTDRL